MPSTTTGVTWYTDCVTTPLKPKAVKGAPGENRALARAIDILNIVDLTRMSLGQRSHDLNV